MIQEVSLKICHPLLLLQVANMNLAIGHLKSFFSCQMGKLFISFQLPENLTLLE